MNLPGETPAGSVVETPSGLIVPADSIPSERVSWPEGVPVDPDGRKRIVLTRDDRRAINRAIRVLQVNGLGIVVGCKGLCGQPLVNEGTDADGQRDGDSGYGCGCSRVHFQ